jgi:ribulose-phosphate 3-epimerase
MKISASIYSDEKRTLEETILDLSKHHVDLLHVDCNDDENVFFDIKKIRKLCNIPIDLHIITENPEKYLDLLIQNPVEYITFQYENLTNPISLPPSIKAKMGIAITTNTPISVFEKFQYFDFILMMATIPGESGGVFDTLNFKKIRDFKKHFPSKSIHVDGGVNGEISFIIRNMGVSTAVSGSYLFNQASVGEALMNLTKREVNSQFKVKDFMIPLSESPIIKTKDLSLKNVLETIETGQQGFCLVVGELNEFIGLISNADIRRGLLKNTDDFNQTNVQHIINKNAVYISENNSVNELLQVVKKCSFPIMYLPVLDSLGNASGIVTFVNLIKGEV